MMYPYDVKEYEMLAWAQGLGDYHCEYGKTAEFNEEPEVVWFPQTRSLCIQPHPEWMQHMMMFPVYCREQVYRKIIKRAS
jgi:hypothetical protein